MTKMTSIKLGYSYFHDIGMSTVYKVNREIADCTTTNISTVNK